MLTRTIHNTLKKAYKKSKKYLKPVAKQAQQWKLIPSKIGVPHEELPNFFETLASEDCRYVVLRWFEDLPDLRDDDLDLLVADDDLTKLLTHTTKGYRGDSVIKMDINTVTKNPRAKGSTSYYPPHLAREILENSAVHSSGALVPNDTYYLLSLAYHALFHKGFASGLPSVHRSEPPTQSEHDYAATLSALATRCGFSIEMTMEGIEAFLAEHNWTPPLDIYYRLSRANQWVRYRAEYHTKDAWRHSYGLSVILLREKGDAPDITEKLEQEFSSHDLVIEETHRLSPVQSHYIAQNTRGGDWNIGPFSVNGGDPVVAYVVRKNTEEKQEGPESLPHGKIEYPWIKKIKRNIRRYCHARNAEGSFNPLHTSDNGVDACYYRELLHTATESEPSHL